MNFRAWRKTALLQGQRQSRRADLLPGQLKSRQREHGGQWHRPGRRTISRRTSLNTTDFMSEADALTIQRNALQTRVGLPHGTTNQQIGATMARRRGRRQPFVSAATSLVGSATAVASRWYAGQQLRM